MQPALDYLRPSPVRGQLEPPDANTLPGWRYIQTTDTPNEFKVLLPPGTAAMYEQLLKFEALELSRKSTILWERIMQIRHLKDRMIRKSQRLSKTSFPKKLSKGEPLTFQTIVAPADFRVKEMEKWFREQQRRASAVGRRQAEPVRYLGLNGHSNKINLLHEPDYHRLPLSDRSHSLPSSSKNPIAVTRPKAIPPSAPQNVRTDIHLQSGQSRGQASVQATKTPSALSVPLPAIFSPPALPILLRSERSALESKLNGHSEKESMPSLLRTDSSEFSLPNASHVAVKGSVSPASSSQESVALAEPDEAAASGELQLVRRRSCIKRSSIGDIPKAVSWADDTEQLSKYIDAAREAQLSGRRWQEIQEIYLDQVSGLDTLCEQVAQGLDNLRLESENLRRVEKAIVQQREGLRATFQNLEQKQSLLQSKVQEALQEADHVLSLAGITKKDG